MTRTFLSAFVAAVAWFAGEWIVSEAKRRSEKSEDVDCPCCRGTGRRKRRELG